MSIVKAEYSSSTGLCPIVFACDEGYAMPLATTLLSLADSNRRHWPLRITILHDGFSESAKERVARSLPTGAAELTWTVIDLGAFAGFVHRMPWVSAMTYARLQLQESLNGALGRVIFLDSDILVLDDLGELARADLRGHPLAAVPDAHVDDALRTGLRPEHEGVPQVQGYFNAGVLVIDLDEWKLCSVSDRALCYLAEHANLPYGDQDALNAACDGMWQRLPSRWNFQLHHATRIERLPALERPAIVHFVTKWKPWKTSSASINSKLYNTYRDRTSYRRKRMQKVRDAVETLGYRLKYRLDRALAGRKSA